MKVEELKSLETVKELLELKPDAQYIVAIPPNIPMISAIEFQEYLRSRGVNCIVVPISDIKIFEVKDSTTVQIPHAGVQPD